MKKFFLLITLGILVSSCSKYEGEGGSSTIKGVVREQRFNSLGNLISEYPIGDHDVYIIYGNESTFYDGSCCYLISHPKHGGGYIPNRTPYPSCVC